MLDPLLFLCAIFFAWNVSAKENALDAAQIDREPVSLIQYLAVLEDPDATLTLADVQAPAVAKRFERVPPTTHSLAYGTNRSPHWFRFRIANSTEVPLNRMIELEFPRISHVDFHQRLPDGTYQSILTGAARPFSTRAYSNRNLVFPVTVPPHTEQTYYMRLQSNSDLVVPAQIWTPSAFRDHELRDYAFQAWYFGIAFAMLVFNLLLFVALRDTIYLLYVIFAAITIVTFATFFGLSHEFLWPSAGWWAEKAMSITAVFQASAFAFFTRRMLDTRANIPKFDRLLLILVVIANVMLVGDLSSVPAAFTLGQLCLLVTYLYIFWIAMYCVYRRQRNAYFFAVAFTLYLIGVNMYTMMSMGILPHTPITANGGMVGSGLEMLLLAFALADRFNVLRKEKAKAQTAALRAQADAMQAQKEKMTSLTQLITNVAHEINTPIGAVKSSGKSISDSIKLALVEMPKLFKVLNEAEEKLFIELVGHIGNQDTALTTREERAIKHQVARQLEEAGVDGADWKARTLVQFCAQARPLDYLPLLKHPESDFILETAQTLDAIVNSAANINTAVDRVSKIVTTLKSFSQAGNTGQMKEVNLAEGIEAALSNYSNHFKQSTEIIRQYEDLPSLRCLPDELQHVWTHLIHNALQAMNYKGRLTIRLKQAGNEAVVSVSDTGTGIAHEIRERIFEPFFTTRPLGEGAGLGLDIVRKIVDKHKGRIDVQTEVGAGSTFSVYLPYTVASGMAGS